MEINLLLSLKIIQGTSGYKLLSKIKYPQGSDYIPLHNIEVFLLAIKSYSKINFNKAYILLDVDGLSGNELVQISSAIKDSINANVLSVKFDRPDNKSAWINFIQSIDNNGAYLICMNHDMLFSSTKSEFNALIENLGYKILNSPTVLTYCHIPEMVSWASNNLKGYQFVFSNGIWESCSKRFWLDGIYIMSKSTLMKVFDSIIGDGPSYLPRFDWPGVAFKGLEFNTVVVPINLFSHYDGSTHVLCSRLKDYFRVIFKDVPLSLPSKLFLEFIEIFHIAFVYWILTHLIYKRVNFKLFLYKCLGNFIDGKKISNINLTESEYEHLLGLITFYENIIYDNSVLDSRQIKYSLKSYIINVFKKLKYSISK